MQTKNKTAVFGSSDEEFDRWQKWLEESDDTLLRWLWESDCGPGGSDGVFSGWISDFGKVTLDVCLLKGYEVFEETECPYGEEKDEFYEERVKRYEELKRQILEEHPLLFSLRDEVEDLRRELGLEEEEE